MIDNTDRVVPQEGHGTPVIVLIGQTVISFVLALETKK
jgi:hypothetical protein